jgi:hypothetical protein
MICPLFSYVLRFVKMLFFWLKTCCYSFLEQPGFEGETTGTDGSQLFFSNILYYFSFDITLFRSHVSWKHTYIKRIKKLT